MPLKDRHLDVAVLGGGFAGVECARAAAKRLGLRKKVGVIARENHMVFQPMLPEVAGGALSPRHVVNPVRLLCKGATVFKGEVTDIDLDEKAFVVDAGSFTPPFRFTYDHLVVALGAVIDLRRIPGMTEHAFLIQNVGDAMKLRAAIIARLEEANFLLDRPGRQALLSFVVVGGGYSGVETAGQIADLLNSIHRFYKNIGPEDFSVTLVHSRPNLLPTLNESLGKYTERCLREQGVDVVLESRVASVTAHQVRLNNGASIAASLVVSTVGTAPHPAIVGLCDRFEVANERYRLVTDEHCRIQGQADLWAVGDCAAVPHPDGGLCPPTAQFAMRQGAAAGQNVVRVFKGDWLRPFRFKGLGELAAIGHHKAVAHVFGHNFSGFLAWWMWRTIYLMKLPGLDRKIRVALEWTLETFFPRDINLLTPRYSSSLSEVHLEPDDILFHEGEPAFSFYMVKAGKVEIRDAAGSVVRAIGAGGHFGERALLADKVWRYEAVAVEPTTLVALSDRVFQQLAASSGSIAGLLGRSANTYRSTEEIGRLIDRIPESNRAKRVGDLMSEAPITVEPDQEVASVLRVFEENPHSCYPLVDSKGLYVGALRREGFYDWMRDVSPSDSDPVFEAPRALVPTVRPSFPVVEMARMFVRSSATKAAVTDGENRLLGIIGLRDLLEVSD